MGCCCSSQDAEGTDYTGKKDTNQEKKPLKKQPPKAVKNGGPPANTRSPEPNGEVPKRRPVNKPKKSYSSTPGPADYSTVDAEPLVKPSKPAYTFGIKSDEPHFPNNPGPADYNIPPKTSHHGPESNYGKFTMQGRSDSSHGDNNTPGPGYYDYDSALEKTRKRVPGATIRGRDSSQTMSDTPGPGYYNPSNTQSPRPVQIKSRPKDNSVQSDTPGPNYYQVDPNIAHKTGHGQPAFSIRGRDGDMWVKKNNTPGPGSYTPDLNKEVYHGPVHSFGGKYKDDLQNTNPGPGYYDPDPMIGKTITSTKPSAPAFSLGLRNREGDVNTSQRRRKAGQNETEQTAENSQVDKNNNTKKKK